MPPTPGSICTAAPTASGQPSHTKPPCCTRPSTLNFNLAMARRSLLALFQNFQGGFQGRQELVNRLALQAVDDIVPAPGGEDGFPAPGAPGTIFRGQLQVYNQLGDGQVIYMHYLILNFGFQAGPGNFFLGKKFPN